MHEVLVNCLGGLNLPRKSVVRLTDRPDMTLDVYRGRETTMHQQQRQNLTERINSRKGTIYLEHFAVRTKMHLASASSEYYIYSLSGSR